MIEAQVSSTAGPTEVEGEDFLRVPALKVRQNGHDLYMVDLPADVLLKHAQVDKFRYSSTGLDPLQKGYQREELRAHANKVGVYLVKNKKAILPTSLLLSVRGTVIFEPLSGSETMGFLLIPKETLPLWIVDGQHRIAGLRHAIEDIGDEAVKGFTLPAVIMANMPKFDEVQQFFIVNSTSKRIKTDLAQRLLTEMAEKDDSVKAAVIGKGQAHLLRAVKIVEILNEMAGGPWAGRIQRVNGRRIGDVMITESSFNESLKPILTIPWVQKQSDSQVAEIINRFWMAIRKYLPEAFAAPREFALQKTVGVYPWHMVATNIFESCRSAKDFSVDYMVTCLKPVEEFLTEDYWAVGGNATQYSSRAGFAILANEIMSALPEAEDVTVV